jgi:hypothetical protein
VSDAFHLCALVVAFGAPLSCVGWLVDRWPCREVRDVEAHTEQMRALQDAERRR